MKPFDLFSKNFDSSDSSFADLIHMFVSFVSYYNWIDEFIRYQFLAENKKRQFDNE